MGRSGQMEEDAKALRNDLRTFKGYRVVQGAWTDTVHPRCWVLRMRDSANKQINSFFILF